MTDVAPDFPHRRTIVRRSRTVLAAIAVGSIVTLSACASTVQGATAGNTRLNTATPQVSAPLDSSEVLTPQSSPQQPSGAQTPGATVDAAPSPDGNQTISLRAQLHAIDAALDTDDAVARSMAVCTVTLGDADPLQVAAAVRAQFGASLASGTVTAIQNVITSSFCRR